MSSDDMKMRSASAILGFSSQEGPQGDVAGRGDQVQAIEYVQSSGDSFIIEVPLVDVSASGPKPPNPLLAARNPYASAGDVALLYGMDGCISGKLTARKIRDEIWRVYNATMPSMSVEPFVLSDLERFILSKLDRDRPIPENLPQRTLEFTRFLREAFVISSHGVAEWARRRQRYGLEGGVVWKRLSGNFELGSGGANRELKFSNAINGLVPRDRVVDAIILANGMLRERGYVPLELWMLGASRRDILIFRIRQLAAVIGHTPTITEMNSIRWLANPFVYQNTFGTKCRAMREAGLLPKGAKRTRGEIIQDLTTFGGVKVGGTTRVKDLVGRPGVPSLDQIRKRFGTVENALSAVGASTSRKGRRTTPHVFVEEMRSFIERHGEPPEIRVLGGRGGRDYFVHRIVYGFMVDGANGKPEPRPGHELRVRLVPLRNGESLKDLIDRASGRAIAAPPIQPPVPAVATMPAVPAPPFNPSSMTVACNLVSATVTSTLPGILAFK